MAESAPTKKSVAAVLEITPQMLALAEKFEAEGSQLVGFDGPAVKAFIEKEQQFLTEFRSLLGDLALYPNQPEVKNAYEKAKEQFERLAKIRALLAKQAVDERAAIPDNRLN